MRCTVEAQRSSQQVDHPHGTTVGMWTSWDNDDCYSVVFELSHGKACLSLCIYVWFNVSDLKVVLVQGAIKQFSAWPSSVQNKIKIVFASDINKAQNATFTIWLLGYKYFVHFSGRQLFAVKMGKMELRSVMKWHFWPICSFHCMLCCSDSKSKWWIHVSSWITSCEINFC